MRLSDEQRMLRDTVREFAQKELAPNAAAWDREARFPKEALAESGRPWMTWVGGQPPIRDGFIEITDEPGFGVAIDEANLHVL